MSFTECQHKPHTQPGAIALVSIGNSLRGDDGIAEALCDALPSEVLSQVCRFDLGCYTAHLPGCVNGHAATIIIDAIETQSSQMQTQIIHLNELLSMNEALNIRSTHGFSILDELRMGLRLNQSSTPKLILFGIEVADVDWNDKLSPSLKASLPRLSQRLAELIIQTSNEISD